MNNVSEFGKMPPQSVELEEAILGSLLLSKEAYYEVCTILKVESFYKGVHQIIYEAICELSEESGSEVDMITVVERLRKKEKLEEVGGPFYIAKLTERIGSSANIKYHASIVQQHYIKRELIRVSTEIQNKAYDDSIDIDELIEFSEQSIFDVNNYTVDVEAVKAHDSMLKVAVEIEKAFENEEKLLGVHSGLNSVDRYTNGWQAPDLIIIAARPSMGKTAFALLFAKTACFEMPVMMFSLEMSKEQLVTRLISSDVDISPMKLKSGNFDQHYFEIIDNSIAKWKNGKLYIDDQSALSIVELKSKIRRYIMSLGIKLIIIDYLQLMKGTAKFKGNREQEISQISRELKCIAKDYNLPVIALSQLNRSVEVRAGDKRPQLSDLRESGAIEQDADQVAFIHRPERYGMLEDEEGNSLKGITEVIIAKNRNGAVGIALAKNNESMTKITDVDCIEVEESINIPDRYIEPNIEF